MNGVFRDQRRQECLSLQDFSNGCEQFLHGSVLYNIRGSTSAECFCSQLCVQTHGENHDFGEWYETFKFFAGIKAVEPRHGDIHQGHIGFQFRTDFQQRATIIDHCHYVELWFEKSPKCLGDKGVIVSYNQPGSMSHVHAKPYLHGATIRVCDNLNQTWSHQTTRWRTENYLHEQ